MEQLKFVFLSRRYIYVMKHCIFFLLAIGLLTGCANSSELLGKVDADTEYVEVSRYLTIENTNPSLTLADNKDVLAANGLYYAAWVMGNSIEYENSDGDIIDLYDAQLYLLLSESRNNTEAGQNMNSWLGAEKNSYEILDEEEFICDEQSYTVITYDCVSEENPYARGVSAFTTFENCSVCVELTCREDFEGDLNAILTDFLNRCQFHND